MRFAARGIVLMGVVVFTLPMLLIACGYAAVDGDNLVSGEKLPTRADAGSGEDAKDAAPTPNPSSSSDASVVDAKPPSQTCAAADLALCFTFEGAVKDQSTSPVTPATIQGVTFALGKEGMAGSFDANSAIRFTPNAVFDLPANGATVEAWVKRQNANADAVVFDDDGRFSLTINAAGHVWCKSSGGAITGTKIVPVDEWAHVACVIDNGAMRAYLNGVQDVAGAGSITPAPNLPAALGGNAPDGEPWLGLIDSFRVFRVARTTQEIAAAAAQ